MKDTKLDLRLSSDLKSRVDEEAKRDGRSMAGVVLKALQEYLSKREEKK